VTQSTIPKKNYTSVDGLVCFKKHSDSESVWITKVESEEDETEQDLEDFQDVESDDMSSVNESVSSTSEEEAVFTDEELSFSTNASEDDTDES
jgi:hypothetical protein